MKEKCPTCGTDSTTVDRAKYLKEGIQIAADHIMRVDGGKDEALFYSEILKCWAEKFEPDSKSGGQ